MPCKHCQRLKRHCHYPRSQRGKRRKSRHSPGQRRDSKTAHCVRRTIRPNLPAAAHNLSEGVYSLNATPLISDSSGHWPRAQRREHAQIQQSPVQVSGRSRSVPEHIATNTSEDTTNQADSNQCLVPLHKVNWEYHGPWSWVSICSSPGVAWVCGRTNSNEFDGIASYFMKS